MRLFFFLLILFQVLPVFAPYDPMQTHTENINTPPDNIYLMGTDMLGRDVLSRMLYGGQRTVFTAFAATLIAVIPGALIGLSAGYYGGWLERLVIVVNNALLAFPGMIFAFVVATLTGQSAGSIALAVGLAQVAAVMQVARSAAVSIRNATYIEGATAIGASQVYILWRYIFPNCLPILMSYGLIVFSYCILNSAALSFLGFGDQPGIPDWGVMLAEGRGVFREAPWVSFYPGMAITLIVFIINAHYE
jgi:peptide/nickel transport system permease protein